MNATAHPLAVFRTSGLRARLTAALLAAVPVLVPVLLIVLTLTAAAGWLAGPGPEPIAGLPGGIDAAADCVMFCAPPAPPAPADCVLICPTPEPPAAPVAPATDRPALAYAAGAVLTGFGRL